LLAVLVARLLQVVAGFFIFYGATAMLTSAGLQPPNIVVLAGLAAAALCTISASRAERRALASLWVAGVVVAVPFLLWSVVHLADPVCPPDHLPLSQAYYCAPPGAGAVLTISGAALALSLWGAAADVRAVIRSLR
jgi:hypothetical protein